jgi:hypothetical protein
MQRLSTRPAQPCPAARPTHRRAVGCEDSCRPAQQLPTVNQHPGSGTGTGMLGGPGTSPCSWSPESGGHRRLTLRRGGLQSDESGGCTRTLQQNFISLADSFDCQKGSMLGASVCSTAASTMRPIAPPAGLQQTLWPVHFMLTPPLWPLSTLHRLDHSGPLPECCHQDPLPLC